MTNDLESFPGKRSKAFRAVEAVLREYPPLVSVVKNWMSWDGSRDDIMTPACAMMPMIRLSPVPIANRPITEMQKACTLGVSVEVFTPSATGDYILNLWDLVEDAIVQGRPFRNTTVQCFLTHEIGAYQCEAVFPGIGAFRDVGNGVYLAGEGQIIVSFLKRR